MFQNYFIIAWRNLYNQRLFSFINVLGLALGIACFTVLYTMIRYEMRYDLCFKNHQRIYRVTTSINKDHIGLNTPRSAYPLSEKLQESFPDHIEQATRLFKFNLPFQNVQVANRIYHEKLVFYADSNFLDIFDMEMSEGTPQTALLKPNSVVLSAAAAQKYFGKTSALGQKIILRNEDTLTVTAVFAANNNPTHLKFDLLASFSTIYPKPIFSRLHKNWSSLPVWTYFLLKENTNALDVQKALPKLIKNHYESAFSAYCQVDLQRLTDIHLRSNLDYEVSENGDYRYVYIFWGLSLIVLVVAGINYMNLSTARASLRAKEIGVRKALGALRHELIVQFLCESMLLSILAIFVALIMLEWVLPSINNLFEHKLIEVYVMDYQVLMSVFCSGIAVGFLAGLYPAYYLSSIEATDIFKGNFVLNVRSKGFRKVLVIVQFVISFCLLTTTLVCINQLNFLCNSRLGYTKDQILIVPAPYAPLMQQYECFKKDLLQSPEILGVTSMAELIGYNKDIFAFNLSPTDTTEIEFHHGIIVRPDFEKTLGLKLLAGRFFASDYPLTPDKARDCAQKTSYAPDSLSNPDEFNAVIINQEMVKHLGYSKNEDVLGLPFKFVKNRAYNAPSTERIIGVVENFHFMPLYEQVKPFVMVLASGKSKSYTYYLAIRIKKACTESAINYISKIWAGYAEAKAFEYFFLSAKLNTQYVKEQRLGEITAYFSVIAILIACLGLWGLSSFVVARKRKEIGIRKVLGASNLSIVFMLNKDFLILVIQSILIGLTVSYYALNYWLGSFAYHIEMSWIHLAISSVAVFDIALITVSIQTIRASMQNPADIINQE